MSATVGPTRLSTSATWALLRQAWTIVVFAERCGMDELPEELAFEIRALEAITAEHCDGTNPLALPLAHLRGEL